MQPSNLVTQAAKHALSSIETAETPLIPFTLQLQPSSDPRNDKVTLTRHVGELLEESLQQAQNSIKPNSSFTEYALAWDGFITVEGRKWDAILIESGESKTESGSIYAQRYELKESGFFTKKRRNVAAGEPILVGTCASRLWVAAHG